MPLSRESLVNAGLTDDPGGIPIVEGANITTGIPSGLKDVLNSLPTQEGLGAIDFSIDTRKFNFNIKPNADNRLLRAQHQSTLNQFGNFLAQGVLGEVVGGTIEGIGSIGALGEAVFDEINNQDADFNNDIIELGRSIREFGREEFPIFQENPNETFDIKDPAWWFQNGVSVFSTLGLLLPAVGTVGAASYLARLSNLSRRIGSTAKFLAKTGTAAGIMRNGENFREGGEVILQTRQMLINRFKNEEAWQKALQSDAAKELREEGREVTKESLTDFIAAKAAWRSYAVNSANIVFDFAQTAVAFGGLSKLLTRAGAGRRLSKANLGKEVKIGDRILDRFSPIYSSTGRQLTEGVEEMVNFVGTGEGLSLGKNLVGLDDSTFDERLAEYTSDGRFYEAALFGVLGGVAFEGGAKLVRPRNVPTGFKGRLGEIEARKAKVGKVASLIKSIQDGDTVETPSGKKVDYSKFTDERKEGKIREIVNDLGVDIGLSSARSGNVGLALNQIEDVDFQKKLIELGFATEEGIQNAVGELTRGIETGESIFKELNNRIVTVKDEEEEIKNLLAKRFAAKSRKLSIEKDKQDNLRDKLATLKLNSGVLKQVRDVIEGDVDKSITLKAINSLIPQLQVLSEIERTSLNALNSPEGVTEAPTKRFDNLIKNLERKREELNKDEDVIDLSNIEVNNENVTSALREIIDLEADLLASDELVPILEQEVNNSFSEEAVETAKNDFKQIEGDASKFLNKAVKEAINAEIPNFNSATNEQIDNAIKSLQEFAESIPEPSIREKAAKIVDREVDRLNDLKEANQARKEARENNEKPEENRNKELSDLNEENADDSRTDGVLQEVNSSQDESTESARTEETIPEETIPEETIPEETTPEETTPQPVLTQETIPEEVSSQETTPQENVPQESVNLEGTTSIFLIDSANNSSNSITDGSSHTLDEGTGMFDILNGELSEGDTVTLRVVRPKKTKNITPDNITIEIINSKGNKIGAVNTILGKDKFIEILKTKLSRNQTLSEAEKDERIKGAEKDLQTIRSLRNKAAKMLQGASKTESSIDIGNAKIIKLNSGSIINIAKKVRLFDSFGENIKLYTIGSSPTNLKAFNAPESEREFSRRTRDFESVLNNRDKTYTKGAIYTVVEAPNEERFPVKLVSQRLTTPFQERVGGLIKQLIENVTLNSSSFLTSQAGIKLKDTINQITFQGKGGVYFTQDRLELSYIDESGTRKRVEIFYNKKDKTDTTILRIRESIQQKNGKFKVTKPSKDISIDQIESSSLIKKALPRLLRNIDGNLANTNKEYISPLDNSTVYSNYNTFINETRGLVTDVGVVKNSKGEIITNFSLKGKAPKSNLVLAIGEFNLNKEQKTEEDEGFLFSSVKPLATKEQLEKDTSTVTHKLSNADWSGSIIDFAKSVGLENSKFMPILEAARKLGVNMSSESVSSQGNTNAFAIYDSSNNTISFARNAIEMAESTEEVKVSLEEALAHEAIHAILSRGIVDKARLDNDLLAFVNSIKDKILDAPSDVRSKLSHIINNSPQEVVAFAYTNLSMAKWLTSLSADKDIVPGKKETLWQQLKNIILDIIEQITGQPTKLDELTKILDGQGLSFNVKNEDINTNTDNNDLTQFMIPLETNKKADTGSLSNVETRLAVNAIIPLFEISKRNNPDFSEEQHKTTIIDAFKRKSVELNESQRTNVNRVLTEFGNIWEITKDKIVQQSGVAAFEDVLNQESVLLVKPFEDEGTLSINPKNRVTDLLKSIIRTTFAVEKIDITKDGKKRYVPKTSNFLGLKQFLDFDSVYPYLLNNLANIHSTEGMLFKLGQLSRFDPSLGYLKDQLESNERWLSAWFSHFSNQSPRADLDIVELLDDDSITHKTLISNNNSPQLNLASEWSTNILSRFEDGLFSIKEVRTKINKLERLLDNFPKNKDSIFKELSNVYSLLGFDVVRDGENFLEQMFEAESQDAIGLNSFGNPSSLLEFRFITPLNRILNTLSEGGVDILGDIRRVTRRTSLYRFDVTENSYLNGENNLVQSVYLPTFLSDFFALAKSQIPEEKTEFKRQLLNYLNSKNLNRSNWLRQIVKFEGDNFLTDSEGLPVLNTDFLERFGYTLFDAVKNADEFVGTKYSKLDNNGWNLINVLKFINDTDVLNRKTINTAKYSIPIPSDGGVVYYIRSKRYRGNFSPGGVLQKGNELHDALRNIILQEMDSMIHAKNALFELDNDGLPVVDAETRELKLKEGLKEEQLLLDYHYTLDSNGNRVYSKDGIPVGRVFQFHHFPSLNNSNLRLNGVIKNGLQGNESIEQIEDAIAEFVFLETQRVKESFEPIRKNIESITSKQNLNYDEFVSEFALNYFIANTETLNLFIGSPSEFKESSNDGQVNKRAKGFIVPGIKGSGINTKNNITYKVLADVVFSSKLANRVEELTNKETANLYRNFESTDASGYITLERLKNILLDEGKLTPNLEELIERASRGENLESDELQTLLEPRKGFYHGRFFDNDLGIFVTRQIKYSTIPLIPRLTKGLEIDKIRTDMEGNGVDEVIYASASKVGTKNVTRIHDEEGNVNIASLKSAPIETIPSRFWQTVLEVPGHIQDSRTKLATQVSRIFHGNLQKDKKYTVDGKSIQGDKLLKLFFDIYSQNIVDSGTRLVEELGGIIENDDLQTTLLNLQKLRSIFRKEASDRLLPLNYDQALQTPLTGKEEFNLPLFSPNLGRKFEALATSLFTNRVTNQKLPGFAAVQFSNTFMKRGQTVEDLGEVLDTGIEYTKEVLEREEGLELQYVEKGNIMEAEVLVPRWTSKFFSKNGNPVPIDSIPDEALEMLGIRIPTDSKSTTVVLKVVGFLPKESSSLINIPKELAVQMNSDFDVDELFMFRYNLDNNRKKIKYNSSKLPSDNSIQARENRLIDIMRSVLSDKKHRVEVLNATGFSRLEKAADRLDELKGVKQLEQAFSSYSSQLSFRKQNIAGRELKGIAANLNSFLPVAQEIKGRIRKDIAFKFKYSKKALDVDTVRKRYADSIVNEDKDSITIEFSNVGHTVDGSNLNIQGELLTEISAETLAAAVDNVNNPVLGRIGTTTLTFPIFHSLVSTGIDINTAASFISQPSVGLISEVNDRKEAETAIITEIIAVTRNVTLERAKVIAETFKKLKRAEVVQRLGFNPYKVTAFSFGQLNKAIKDSSKFPLLTKEGQEVDRSQERLTYLSNQLRVVHNFYTFKKASDAINTTVQASKLDTIGAGPFLSTTDEILNKIRDASIYPFDFGNNKEQLGPRFLSGEQAAIQAILPLDLTQDSPIIDVEESAYKPLAAFYNYSNLLSLKFYSNVFIQASRAYRNLSNFAVNRGVKNDPALLNRLHNFSTSTLLRLGNDFFAHIDTARVMGITQNNADDLRESNKSTAQKLKELKQKRKDLLGTGEHILDFLNPKISESDIEENKGLHIIDFRQVNDNNRENILTESLLNMINATNATIESKLRKGQKLNKEEQDRVDLRELGEDLIRYSFATNGMNFGRNSFSNIIPTETLVSLGVGKTLGNALKVANKSDVMDVFDFVHIGDFIRNNWKNPDVVPRVRGRKWRPNSKGYLVVNKESNEYNKVASAPFIYNPRFSFKDKKFIQDSDFIYARIGESNNNVFYTPVEKLGIPGRFVEYGRTEIESNNPYLGDKLPFNSFEEAVNNLMEDESVHVLPEFIDWNARLDERNEPIDLSIEEENTGTEGVENAEEFERKLKELKAKSSQRQEFSEGELEQKDAIAEKVETLKRNFAGAGINVEIIFNEELEDTETNARVLPQNSDGSFTIELNPKRVFDDTVIHEFGHIYIDLLGINHPLVQSGIKQLKGSKLWNDVANTYKDLSGDRLAKEVLVTAIGREGVGVFKDSKKQNRLVRWIRNLFNRIARIFGINNNSARELARQMIDSDIQRKLDGKPSDYIQEQKSKNKAEETASEFIDRKIKSLFKQIDKFRDNRKFRQETEHLINLLDRLEPARGLALIQESLDSTFNGVVKRLNKVEAIDFENLSKDELIKEERRAIAILYNAVTITKSFKDIHNLNRSDFVGTEMEEIVNKIKDNLPLFSDIEVKWRRLTEELLSRKLGRISSNPVIMEDVKQVFRLDRDEGKVQAWLDAMADTNNSIAALTIKNYNIANDKARLEARELKKEFEAAIKKFKSEGGDIDILFERDKSGKRTGFLLTEFRHAEWAAEREEMFEEVKEMREKADNMPEGRERNFLLAKARKKMSKWLGANIEKVDNYAEIVRKKQKELDANEFRIWMEEHHVEAEFFGTRYPKGELTQPRKDKWGSKDFERIIKNGTVRDREFHSTVFNMLKKLTKSSRDETFRRGMLPAVPLDQRNIFKAITDTAGLDNIKKDLLTSKDELEVIMDDEENIVNFIPFHYTSKLGQTSLEEIPDDLTEEEKNKLREKNKEIREQNRRNHAENLDFNIEETMKAFIDTAINHQFKTEIKEQILLTREILTHQQLLRTAPWGEIFIDKKATERGGKEVKAVKSAVGSNILDHFDEWIEGIFFEDFDVKEPPWLRKGARLLQNYASLRNLGFNYFSGINNKVFGEIQLAIEAAAGFWVNGENYRKAKVRYNENILHFIAERNKPTATVKEDAIAKLFGVLQHQDELSRRQVGPIKTKLHKLKWITDSAYAMLHMGEHSMQNQLLFAMMDGYKVADGKIYRNAEQWAKRNKIPFEDNKQREEARNQFNKFESVWDTYELKEGYAEVKEGKKIDVEEFSIFRREVIAVNQYLHGIYADEDASALQRRALGKLAIQFRKWMRPGWNKRWRNGKDKFWNERRNAPDEGMYITTLKFGISLIKDFNNITTNYKVHWNSLSDFERANLRRTFVEFLFFTGTIIAGSLLQLLAEADEDDDDVTLEDHVFNIFVYQQDRLWTELFTYTPPGIYNEGMKLVRSPAATFDVMSDSVRLFQDLLLYPIRSKDERVFQGGVNYGEDKVNRRISEMVPLWRIIERQQRLEANNKFYKLVQPFSL